MRSLRCRGSLRTHEPAKSRTPRTTLYEQSAIFYGRCWTRSTLPMCNPAGRRPAHFSPGQNEISVSELKRGIKWAPTGRHRLERKRWSKQRCNRASQESCFNRKQESVSLNLLITLASHLLSLTRGRTVRVRWRVTSLLRAL